MADLDTNKPIDHKDKMTKKKKCIFWTEAMR